MFVGVGSGIDFLRFLDIEIDLVVRDLACSIRYDDFRIYWSWKD